MQTRRALALARQPFSLQCQTLKRRLKLAANLHQSFGDRRVRQKLCAGTLDLRFGFGDFNDALAVSVFGRLKHERVIFTCRAQFRIMLTPRNDPKSHHDHFHIEANPDYSAP